MRNETKNLIIGMICATIIVGSFSFAGRAYASKQPSKYDLKTIAAIQKNQALIAQAKEWNRLEVKKLNSNGWNVDWRTTSIIPQVVDISKFDTNTRLTNNELRTVLLNVGFKQNQLRIAMAVARAESGWRPLALNWSKKDHSYGIYQVNMIGKTGRKRLQAYQEQYGIRSPEDLYDPVVNAKIAYAISNGGKNWKAWGAYTNGSYRQYLDL